MTLEDLRIRRDLSQEETSKLIGTTVEYVSMIERGLRNPSDKLKSKLAKAYRVPDVDIFLACKETKRCIKQKRGKK